MEFNFPNVQVFGVDPLALGNCLGNGSLNNNPVVDRYFFDDDTDAFVITEVLKSNSITVKAQQDSSAGVGLDLPAIQAAVGVKVEVKQTSSSTSELTYTGTDALTFGHKVFRIDFINGEWAIQGQKPSGSIAFSTPVWQTTTVSTRATDRSSLSACHISGNEYLVKSSKHLR